MNMREQFETDNKVFDLFGQHLREACDRFLLPIHDEVEREMQQDAQNEISRLSLALLRQYVLYVKEGSGLEGVAVHAHPEDGGHRHLVLTKEIKGEKWCWEFFYSTKGFLMGTLVLPTGTSIALGHDEECKRAYSVLIQELLNDSP